jgi:glycosyltransferase involved in cell wall biosynthesis
MPFADEYLSRHRIFPRLAEPPPKRPGIIVVIPCYNEPGLLRSLQALHDCEKPSCYTEIIVVVNHPEDAPPENRRQNEQSLHEMRRWAKEHDSPQLRWHSIYLPDVPLKDSGVGYARKAGMDEAVYRFNLFDAGEGIIVGFDADSLCDADYLTALEDGFSHPEINGASVYFEHPTGGDEFPRRLYEGIILYELHLRYLNEAMRYAGFQHAFHTVGSAFAVRASVYAKQGGMNKRKAGEDFHFLHKIIPLGHYAEINCTRVIPSPRMSDRVPFGTGAGLRRWMNEGPAALFTYPPAAFDPLKAFFKLAPSFYQAGVEKTEQRCASLPEPICRYLRQIDYLRHIAAIQRNSASEDSFQKHFRAWFGGLHVIKYLNYSCGNHFEKQPPDRAAGELLRRLHAGPVPATAEELLRYYRDWERGGKNRDTDA